LRIIRVGQNRIYTPYMTIRLVISLPKIPYIHRIYVWFWPTLRIIASMNSSWTQTRSVYGAHDYSAHDYSVGLARTIYLHLI